VDEAQATALEFGAGFSNLTVSMRKLGIHVADNGAESRDKEGHTLALTSRTASSSATWSTKSWTPSVKRTINWRGGIGPPSSGMGSARCLPLAFSLRGCICCKLQYLKTCPSGVSGRLLRNGCYRTATAAQPMQNSIATSIDSNAGKETNDNFSTRCHIQRLSRSPKLVHPEDSRADSKQKRARNRLLLADIADIAVHPHPG
jgi:hypothetical protein